MALVRCRRFVPALIAGLMLAAPLAAQETTGTITGRGVDSTTQQPFLTANVVIMNVKRGTVSRDDGTFTLAHVPAGLQTVRVSRIGYRPVRQDVTVVACSTATVTFMLNRQA